MTLAKNSSKLSLGAIFVFILGFLNTGLFAAKFGMSTLTDAFFLAQTIPFLLLRLFASSSDSLLIPIFVNHLSRDEDRLNNKNFWASIWLYGILFFGALAILGFVLSPVFFPFYTEKDKIIAISRLFFIFLLFSGLSELLKSAINSTEHFFISTFSDSFKYLGSIVGVVALGNSLGILSSVMGYLLGAIVQTTFLILQAYFFGIPILFTIQKPHKELKRIAKSAFIVIGGNIFGFLMEVVERFFAAGLGVGILTMLGYARQITFSIFAIANKGINTAILPKLTSIVIYRNLRPKLIEVMQEGARLSILVTVTLGFGLVAFAKPVTNLLFLHGIFPASAISTIVVIIILFVPSIVFGGLNTVFLSPYYASGNVRVSAIQSFFMLVVYSILSLILKEIYGLNGLVLSFSVVHMLAFAGIFMKFKNDFGWDNASIIPLVFGLFVGGIVLICESIAGQFFVTVFFDQRRTFVVAVIELAVLAFFGMFLYLLILKILRVKEIVSLFDFVGNIRKS